SSTTCTVTLSKAAPANGAVVNLSDNSAALTVPASVTVPANAATATFSASTGAFSAASTAVITASFSSVSKTASISLILALLSSLECNPVKLAGGIAGTCTVTLTGPGNGATVTVSSSNAGLIAPSGVTVPAGASTARFSFSTGSGLSGAASLTATL